MKPAFRDKITSELIAKLLFDQPVAADILLRNGFDGFDSMDDQELLVTYQFLSGADDERTWMEWAEGYELDGDSTEEGWQDDIESQPSPRRRIGFQLDMIAEGDYEWEDEAEDPEPVCPATR